MKNKRKTNVVWVRDFSEGSDKRLIGRKRKHKLPDGRQVDTIKWIDGRETLILAPENLKPVKL